jgi:hypothetical protein
MSIYSVPLDLLHADTAKIVGPLFAVNIQKVTNNNNDDNNNNNKSNYLCASCLNSPVANYKDSTRQDQHPDKKIKKKGSNSNKSKFIIIVQANKAGPN